MSERTKVKVHPEGSICEQFGYTSKLSIYQNCVENKKYTKTCIATCFILIFVYAKTEIRLDITEEEKLKAEQKIENTLTSETIYDVKCVLEKADSGYNILIVNQAQPESIQSFIDPTIVAWYLADYTKYTDWKSETLFIWTKPYREGWGILTKDCRFATRKARDVFGYFSFLGIVDMATLRKEVSKKFFRLKPSTGEMIKNIFINPWLITLILAIFIGVLLFALIKQNKRRIG